MNPILNQETLISLILVLIGLSQYQLVRLYREFYFDVKLRILSLMLTINLLVFLFISMLTQAFTIKDTSLFLDYTNKDIISFLGTNKLIFLLIILILITWVLAHTQFKLKKTLVSCIIFMMTLILLRASTTSLSIFSLLETCLLFLTMITWFITLGKIREIKKLLQSARGFISEKLIKLDLISPISLILILAGITMYDLGLILKNQITLFCLASVFLSIIFTSLIVYESQKCLMKYKRLRSIELKHLIVL